MEYYKNLSLEPLFYINKEGLVCQEEFKDIPGYEGMYQVSDLGRVKSLKFNKQKILKQGFSQGYLTNVFCFNQKQKSFTVHKLVAMAFLNHIPDGTTKIVVDHKNNNPLDNRLENLQIITNRENLSKDKIGKGTSDFTGVYWNKKRKKWAAEICFDNKKTYLGLFVSEFEALECYKKALKSVNENKKVKKKKPSYSSKYKGVNWDKQSNSWRAYVTIKGKFKNLGYYKTELEASIKVKEYLKIIQTK